MIKILTVLFTFNLAMCAAEPNDSINELWERASDYSVRHDHDASIKIINVLIGYSPNNPFLYVK